MSRNPVSVRWRRSLGVAALALLGACADDPLATEPLIEPQLAKGVKNTWTVTSLDDPGAGACSNTCTLRQAIEAAQSGDRIVFKNNLSGTIALTAGQLLLDKDLSIEGGGRITIDAQGASRVIDVSPGITVSLDGLTITGGQDGPDTGFGGGGIRNRGATLTLSNSTVRGNSAVIGGGIANTFSGTLTIRNSTITDNTARNALLPRGGGIFNTNSTLSVIRSTISGNRAVPGPSGAAGGGLHVELTGTGIASTAVVTASTISGNSAEIGGGIYNSDGTLVIGSSTITMNASSSPDAPGGVASADAAGREITWLANTIVAGNGALDCNPAFGLLEGLAVSLGHNVVGSGCPADGPGDIVAASPAMLFTQFLSSTLADNGGPTKTHALLELGRAIDAGYCPGETTDQRGLPRPVADPRVPNATFGCDIGAFEWQPPAAKPGNGPRK